MAAQRIDTKSVIAATINPVRTPGLSIKMPLPYVYRGDVVIDLTTTRVPGALIRAYVSVSMTEPDGTVKSAVIPVAETRADETGAFELLIPASLDER